MPAFVFVFSCAIFLSALLLFAAQPIFSRMVLPVLGGAPAVWNTAVMFFQGALLAGYTYAYWLSRTRNVRVQVIIHSAVLISAFAVLPVTVPTGWLPPTDSTPALWLVALLTVAVGLPVLALSATAPLLQRWFAHSNHSQGMARKLMQDTIAMGSKLNGRYITLQASIAAAGLYKSLGFTQQFKIRNWSKPS